MATNLFCEHKRLVSVCPMCGSARAGAATPMRGPVTHDVDETWHRLRAACHQRARRFIELVHDGAPAPDAYEDAYDEKRRRGKVHSEEEDPATFRGAYYLAMVKMFDVTIDDRRIQGYNGLADWEEMRDYVFRKFAPDELDDVLGKGRLKIHGGNAAWARQQILTDLLRHDRVEEAVLHVAFGDDGTACTDIDDAEVVARLERVEAIAREVGFKPGLVPFASKILHVFAPRRWPALTAKTRPEAGDEMGHPIPEVRGPADYPAFAEAMRAIMDAEGHKDLDHTDIVVSDAWDMREA